jgi:hypothetical protein
MKPAHRKAMLGKIDKFFIRRLVDLLPPLSTPQANFTSRDILRSVMGAVQDRDFIEGWTDHQREMGGHVPSGDLVHLRLGELTMEDVTSAFKTLNGELLSHLDRVRPWRKPVHLAIDFHSMAYYGKYRGGQVVGAKGHRGTNWGYQFASVQGVCGRRCTFHAVPVVQFTSRAVIIRELLGEARRHVEVSMVYLDRGLYSASCLRELERISVRYLMPVPLNKAVRRLMAELMPYSRVVGTRGWSYSKMMRWVGDKDKVEVQTVFLFRPDPDDEDFVFITNVEVDDRNVEALAEAYSRRWGIETGYRMSEMMRGRTCSRSHAVRRLLHLLSVLLYNVWQLVDALMVHVLGVPRKRWGYSIRLRSFMRMVLELVRMGDTGVGI